MKLTRVQISQIGREPLPNRLPSKAVLISIAFVLTGMLFFSYITYVSPVVTIVDSIVIVLIAVVGALLLNSIFRNPGQFFRALFERIFRPISYVLSLALYALGLASGIVLRIIRLGFCITIAAIYDVWPVDLIPDVFFGIGWVDDAAVTIVMIYIGLFGGRFIVSYGFKEAARSIVANSVIKTKFP